MRPAHVTQPEMTAAQIRAERTVLAHLVAALPTMTDTELDATAAEHAYETGHYPAEARALITAEYDRRAALAHAELVASMAPNVRWTATGGAK